MPFNALDAVGLVAMRTGENSRAVTGTCFRFRDNRIVLTARHCVEDPEREYGAQFPSVDHRGLVATEVIRHETADIALLKLEGYEPQARERDSAFQLVVLPSLAEQFLAYGFPVEGPFESLDGEPVPRVFTGIYQRFFDYKPGPELAYVAGEMSISAPAGLSGGPLFRPSAHTVVTGLVTSNLETYAFADSFEDTTTAGEVKRVELRRVISYGVALQLQSISEWIEAHVPPLNEPPPTTDLSTT